MTTFLLIRHGHTEWVGKAIAGRSPGVGLSEKGKGELPALVQALSSFKIHAIYSSPLDRTLETARPIASSLGIEINVREELNEIDYGEWTGRELQPLRQDPLWARYQRFRSTTRIPGGERFTEVQARVVDVIEELRQAHPEQIVALVSHGDTIRVVIAHYLGMNLDQLTRLVIEPSSVSGLRVTDYGPELLFMNMVPGSRVEQGCRIQDAGCRIQVPGSGQKVLS